MSFPTTPVEIAPWAMRVRGRVEVRMQELATARLAISDSRSACPGADAPMALLNDSTRIAGPYADRWLGYASAAVGSATSAMGELYRAECLLLEGAQQLTEVLRWLDDEARRSRLAAADQPYDFSEVHRIASVLTQTYAIANT